MRTSVDIKKDTWTYAYTLSDKLEEDEGGKCGRTWVDEFQGRLGYRTGFKLYPRKK